ncbi:lysozyme [Novosphingobium huizhouense]|uniref:lysozyme n=1 Tax=Novosphingobium huizhouense TaxID=2866625 RepID=UPI001CD83B5D|nr:lysozyme [Novosphingobium huizhouense]
MNRKPIFDAVRRMLGRGFSTQEVKLLDKAIDAATGSLGANLAPDSPAASAPSAGEASGAARALGPAGQKLIKAWESCGRLRADGRYEAYPDPGSADGRPWTIGWGSTGADIARGTVWTRAQCDARFAADIARYVAEVDRAVGPAPTTPNQFDALVSFHYNTGAIFSATLTRLHTEGRYAEAAEQFGNWIYNNHKPMTGLVRRRAAEAKLYATP